MALLVLGVPIIDTFWIIVGRLTRGVSPFAPDRSHIHHRLLDLGLSHRNTVLVIYGICAALGVLALLVSEIRPLYAFLGVFIVSGLILFAPTRGAFRRPRSSRLPRTRRPSRTETPEHERRPNATRSRPFRRRGGC